MLKRMNATLLKALLALVPTLLLLAGAILVFLRERGTSALLQLLGAASLVLVVLAHICEGLDLFLAMRWARRKASVTISTSAAPLPLSPCFRLATYFTH